MGAWLDAIIKRRERKICATGIHCSRWDTMHGFAFNINVDLNYFDFITPVVYKIKSYVAAKKELGKKFR